MTQICEQKAEIAFQRRWTHSVPLLPLPGGTFVRWPEPAYLVCVLSKVEAARGMQGSFSIPLAVTGQAFAMFKSPCSMVTNSCPLRVRQGAPCLRWQGNGGGGSSRQTCWGQTVRYYSNPSVSGEPHNNPQSRKRQPDGEESTANQEALESGVQAP